jgi:ribosomal protein S18 acetylase RimI-like enzyme
MSAGNPGLKIRKARVGDAERIALLCGQLGYPTTAREMKRRLMAAVGEKNGACFVGEARGEGVIGWIHVSANSLIEVERRAEVNGLVVDEQARNRGAGWKLLEAAEKWARARRCKSMSVRSNALRERAHAFYVRHGYEVYKTQKAFRKRI